MPAQCAVPRLLLITGAPASGKTRLARDLGTRYGCGIGSKDEIKETLFECAGHGRCCLVAPAQRRQLCAAVQFCAPAAGRACLVLLEGNFRVGEHEAPLRSLLERSGAGAAQVLCLAEPATRAARLAARAADPGRHRGHHDPRIDVSAGDGATFLDLPGPRLRFNSEADWQSELAAFCAEFDRWYSPSKV